MLLNNPAVAEEIVQDVFLILLLNRSKVEHYEKLGSWLFRTLYHRIENELQRASHSREVTLGPQHELLVGENREFERLEYVLPSELTPMERQILIWYYEDNLSCAEIAARLYRSEHACHTKLYRAREKCRKLCWKNH